MISNPLYIDTASRARLKDSGVRLLLAFCAGICLLLTFIVPADWLTVFKCPFLTLTGLPCPFCGFTRAIWAISAGDWLYATADCPMAWLIYTVMVFAFARGIGSLIPRIKKTKPSVLSLARNQANHAAAIIISLFLLNWIYRLSLGLA